MTRLSKLMVCMVLLGLTWGCARQTLPETQVEAERAVREAENEASKALAAKDVERLMSFFADDADEMFPNMPIIRGKEAIHKALDKIVTIPGFAMSFQLVKVEASRGGDLVYGSGTYTRTVNDAAGKPVTDTGKYVIIYKKQPDGQWKVVADIGNSDLPGTAG